MTVSTSYFTENTADQLQDQCVVNGINYALINPKKGFGTRVEQLPYVMRYLLENVCRNAEGNEKQVAVDAIFSWLDNGHSVAEIPYQPGRVLMHDTTSTPALVDIAAMRDELREAGVDASLLKPTLNVDVSIDHSLAVEAFGVPGASEENLQHEIRRNQERYKFLKWAADALGGVTIHPPGTGIMHTINLEQLATVVNQVDVGGQQRLVPDMMLGTDSHTPMINGIGVLGWGVGGLEAQTVMFGMPTMLRIPDVIGVKLVGEVSAGVQASDIAIEVTSLLRKIDVTGCFVEFFGPGVTGLSASARSVIANMAPEYGATTGFFTVDQNTLSFLASTGRSAHHIDCVESYAKATSMWFDPLATPTYSREVTLDLSTIGLFAAGPRRPQDRIEVGEIPNAIQSKILAAHELNEDDTLPRWPVALAAITSCTNTSDPALLIAAGVLAKNAVAKGLDVPAWVKTSLAPGSPAAVSYLSRAGVLTALEKLGFGVVGFGCTTCIGNSGPLTPQVADAQKLGHSEPVAFLSGNRNFPGRVHPNIEMSFIMSPAMVVAAAIAGDASVNLSNNALGFDQQGQPVYLADIWPDQEEVERLVADALRSEDFSRDFAEATNNPLWQTLEAPSSDCFPWSPTSTILRRPPFASLKAGSLLGNYTARPLLVTGDDVTTDHISPASAIPSDSFVADFLVERGEDRGDLNVFASRRGNWEVMMRAAFYSRTFNNMLCPDAPVGHTILMPEKKVVPIYEAAQHYSDTNTPVVIVAGERYGMGSSRDWAAKGQRLLGVRAVLAVSFERIHRSNLIGMGILPLTFTDGVTPASLNLLPGEQISISAAPDSLACRGTVIASIQRLNGDVEPLSMHLAVETQLELHLLRVGGVMPMILQRSLQRFSSNVSQEVPS
ncbi:MAG: aconitate hydratase AcnA [Pontibacterium sp.]